MGERIPTQCRARFDWVLNRGNELRESFVNGNKKDVLDELEELASLESPCVAFAVLGAMMHKFDPFAREHMYRFLREMA